MTEYAQAVDRGCGRRKQGGVYAECGSSRKGKPVEAFLLCPPVCVDEKALGLSRIGVKLIDGNVWDWVGTQYYPNVSDFIEVVRRFGMSRRLPKTMDFKKLDPGARMMLLHSKAHIDQPAYHHMDRIGGHALGLDWEWCPIGAHTNDDPGMCAGLWFEDVKKVKRIGDTKTYTIGDKVKDARIGTVEMPSFEYMAAIPPIKNILPLSHSLAIFASFPITRLAVIRAEDGSHNETAELVSKSNIEVEVCDE